MSTSQTAQAECPICGGSGWKIVEGPDRSGGAIRCDCFNARKGERLFKLAGVPSRYATCTFENFVTAHVSLARARIAARHFVDHYPTEKEGLLFVGETGRGKTHLAVAIIRELTSKGIHCLFSEYRDLLKKIQNSYNPKVEATELEILDPIIEAEVLVLDDLGAVRSSEWVWDTVSYIINSRYNDQKATLITTNFPDAAAKSEEEAARESEGERPKPLVRRETLGDRITDRMRSRLHEMCRVVKVAGEDFRLARRKN